ncbi:MAG: Wzz/FepE/Etk N-terminal domain-containing protein [Eubacteriales bacterium]|nr:Wzz/FepE/Etk N-terminal domain-containing protein [Eubacteriales bacterium]
MEKNKTQEQIINYNDQEDTIDLVELFFEILNRWKIILVSMLLCATLTGVYYTFFIHPSYRADAQIYITNTDSVISFSDLQLSSALTEDYASIIKSRTVLKRVINEMKLDMDFEELGGLITVENPEDTHIIHIYVTCNDMELSKNIANALLNISVEQIYQIVGSSEPTIIDYAEADAVVELMPSLFKYLAIGAMAGALLVCAIVVVKTLMNTTLKTEEDIEKYLHMPVLSAVPYYDEETE